MHILFLTQILPLPLDAGPRIRAYYVLRYLAEAGHKVSLVSFIRNEDCEQHVQDLRRFCASVETIHLARSNFRNVCDGIQSLFTDIPFLILRDRVSSMRQELKRILDGQSFDALHADQLWMASYGLEEMGPSLRVLDQHNAVFMVPRRMAEHEKNPLTQIFLQREANKLEAFERQACSRFDRVVWVTDEDRRAVVRNDFPRGRRDCVIPIATDPDVHRRVQRPHPFRVTFVGGMHWPPNLEGISWFTEKIWPVVARAVPSALLTVIGKGSPRDLQQQNDADRIQVTGYVSDLQHYLSETAVFVVPIRSGAGMRVKILDAWCWGIPIVSTTVGAEGLHTKSGENLIIADTESDFADAIVGLFLDPIQAERLASNGRQTVEQMYDWKHAYKAWDQVYN